MGDETVVSDKKDESEIKEKVKQLHGKDIVGEITLSNDKSYSMVDVRYRHIKKCNKVAGGKPDLLNDLMLQEFFPEMTQELIDDLRPRDLKILGDKIKKETGMDIDSVQDF